MPRTAATQSNHVAGSSGGASFSPMESPRPSYPPLRTVLWPQAARTVRFPLLCAAIASASRPLYAWLAAAQFWRRLFQWLAAAGGGGGWLPTWVGAEDVMFAIGLSAALLAVYAVQNGFFAALDRFGWLQQYKLPRRPAQEPSPALVAATLRKELVAHVVSAPVLMVLVVGPFLRWNARRAGVDAVAPAAIPSFSTVWGQMLLTFVLNEVMFYFGHRLLHAKPLYRRIHKTHHSWIATRSYAAEYAHVLEDVLTAYIPFLAGLVISRASGGAHFHVVIVWFCVRVTESYEAHSGFCFRGTLAERWLGLTYGNSAAHHDFHHTANRGNFGNELLDHLCGTMDAWVVGGGADGYMAQKNHGHRGATANGLVGAMRPPPPPPAGAKAKGS